jgi:hypothetical protein
MTIFELDPTGYNIEKSKVELDPSAEIAYQSIKKSLKMPLDQSNKEYYFSTYLDVFFAEYNRINKKGEILDPKNLSVTDISYDRDDLLKFKDSVQNIIFVLDEANSETPLTDYLEYIKQLQFILSETEKKLEKIELDGHENMEIAA